MNALIRWSITNRIVVLALAVLAILVGIRSAAELPVDVFPDLTAPTVTVLTESHGLAPEEVETLVTFPIESALNGAPGVRRVRSASGVGISIVWAEFEWGADIHYARQIVTEKLQLVSSQLPADVSPALAPISSVMGEILFLSIHPDEPTIEKLMTARRVADWQIRRRLLSIRGVSQVIPIGGEVEVYRVLVRPEALAASGVTFEDVERALAFGSQNASGGFYVEGGQEYLLRVIGRAKNLDEIGSTVVAAKDGDPITVRQVARVTRGPKLKRGTGSTDAKPAVVLAVLKQPSANTLELTRRIDLVVDDIERTLPSELTINRNIFRQATFISRAVENVSAALRDGAILVAIILLIFLVNWRATLISLVALPLSLVVGVFVLQLFGITLNTMTLGGFTIAVGSLVDDAIIDVENIIRRLRQNLALPETERRPMADVVYDASVEVRSAILYATLIIILVFVPLFFLSGLEGRMLAPLGLAYVTAIAASLVVAVTVTPAMSMVLLKHKGALGVSEGPVLERLKPLYRRALLWCLARPRAVLAGALAGVLITISSLPFLGRSFLPQFNEGALTVSVITLPGTSLDESNRLGRRMEQALLGVPEVSSTTRRTGRAELDEHAQDVSASEIDVTLDTKTGRGKDEVIVAVREVLAGVPGAAVTVGQPLSHRIDHMLSGTRAALAVKIFGPDLTALRGLAEQVKSAVDSVDGAVDVSIEQQVEIPELEIRADRQALARFGMTAGALSEAVEGRLAGRDVGVVVDELRTIPIVVRLTDDSRQSMQTIAATVIDTPSGHQVPLRALATLVKERGPNTIVREDVQRKLVVQANVAGRDIGSVVGEVRAAIAAAVNMPQGYHVELGGQFESAEEAARTIFILSIAVGLGILLLLTLAYGSLRNALLTLATLPLALIGGVVAVAMSSRVLTIPGLVGFITLFGIATRNGILLVSRFDHPSSAQSSRRDVVVQGSLDRLAPILMTALSAALALVPLALAKGEPGNEIQAPMAVVILGGLLSSTLLTVFVLPVIFERWGAGLRTAQNDAGTRGADAGAPGDAPQ